MNGKQMLGGSMFHIGQWIDNQYQVLEKLVSRWWIQYVVQDRISGNTFLVKRFSDVILLDESARIRFEAKAKIWIGLSEGDETVKAFMVKEYGGIPHIFIEYVAGPTLATIFNAASGKALPLEQTAALMKQLVSAMKVLHNASLFEQSGSVIHGGLNPQVILLHDGNVRITDIGFAPVIHQAAKTKNMSLFKNEIQYLAPEQLRDPASANELTDIYAFGAIMYEAATGTTPPVVKKTQDPLHEFIAVAPVAPRLRNRSCPQWLEETILKCMARDPQNRFQTFDHIADFLAQLLDSGRLPHKLEVEEEGGSASRVARIRGVAKKESRRLNHYYIGVEHMMLGLLAEEESLVVSCFGDQYTAPQIRSELFDRLPKGEGPWYWDGIIKTPRYKNIMKSARIIKREFGHERMLPQHVLLAILEEGKNVPVRALKEMNIDVKAAADYLRQEFIQKIPAFCPNDPDTPLGKCARKLVCARYLPDTIPFINRKDELQAAVHSILDSRRSVILNGPPGIGKKAFVRELECHLEQTCQDNGIPYGGMYELRKADLLSVTEDDEQREELFLNLITSVIGFNGILAVEGLDVLIGIGARARIGFIAEIMTSYLDSNDLIIVATTTPEGVESCEMESKEILSHFDVINLSEPSAETVMEILSAAKDVLEVEHSFTIEPDALAAVMELSGRFAEPAFPARALEVLDRTCIFAKLSGNSQKGVIDSESVTEFIAACSQG
ncbi:MAG: hypothetical protein C4520_07830 [Candidatus Abyssobacteria bacterium SURF_5]|uniref:non-specific serine/threonine protein kinase n=1 Tax=Abyssobacteria bacterium (strain SURF_5) TaxID=2093360 RepID=A0A3A4NQA7_ABYX5|nr:MAG: hypothetical protein C4520_07830 [Candidatus Abyssubacteria bacterium SURF_5]